MVARRSASASGWGGRGCIRKLESSLDRLRYWRHVTDCHIRVRGGPPSPYQVWHGACPRMGESGDPAARENLGGPTVSASDRAPFCRSPYVSVVLEDVSWGLPCPNDCGAGGRSGGNSNGEVVCELDFDV